MTRPRFVLDRCRFPMIWSESVQAYFHWLPVTKVQVEHFLCHRPDPRFDAPWYEGLLALNGRTAPDLLDASNYWQAFATGLTPDECLAFADWCGEGGSGGLALPARGEWLAAYHEFGAAAEIEVADLGEFGPSSRALRVASAVDSALDAARARAGPFALADQMLLRRGVMEWVSCPDRRNPWGAFGQPPQRFLGHLFNPDDGEPVFPTGGGRRRVFSHGFRLVLRPAPGGGRVAERGRSWR